MDLASGTKAEFCKRNQLLTQAEVASGAHNDCLRKGTEEREKRNLHEHPQLEPYVPVQWICVRGQNRNSAKLDSGASYPLDYPSAEVEEETHGDPILGR